MRRSTRAKNAGGRSTTDLDLGDILRPHTKETIATWKGWSEVESDPGLFNVMLREFGVNGLKVREIFSLGNEILNLPPDSVYGFIFLFQYQDEDLAEQVPSCPPHVWFANQTVSNACASIALLNIIMNVKDDHVQLGPELQAFKAHTLDLSPPFRGECICNFEFIRNIHNSFARRIDMLNADLSLSNDASKRSTRGKSWSSGSDTACFHFNAFVPVDGHVWILDGLNRRPIDLGKSQDNWMSLARQVLEEQMQKHGDSQIQYNLLSVCKSPLIMIKDQLSFNFWAVQTIDAHLDALAEDWRNIYSIADNTKVIPGPDDKLNILPEHLNAVQLTTDFRNFLSDPDTSIENCLTRRADLIAERSILRSAFRQEEAEIQEDFNRAEGRKYDYTLFLHKWMSILSDKALLQTFVEA